MREHTHTHARAHHRHNVSQDGGRGSGEEWLDSGCIWKGKSLEFPESLQAGDERGQVLLQGSRSEPSEGEDPVDVDGESRSGADGRV